MLNFTLDYIMLLDKELRFLQVNQNLLEFLAGTTRRYDRETPETPSCNRFSNS